VGSSVVGSMMTLVFKSGGLKCEMRAQISMKGDSFQGLIFSNHSNNSKGVCSGSRSPHHHSYPHRRVYTDEDWVEDKVSSFYNTILCGDYHSYKGLWRDDLDPHKSNMFTPEKFTELSNEFRSKCGYFAFVHFLKADRKIMLSTKYEFEAFFNLRRGIKSHFSFDLKHKMTSAEEEVTEKPKEKKGFLSNISSGIANASNSIANSAIVRDNTDRLKTARDEITKLLDEFEDLKEFIGASTNIEIAPSELPKQSLAPMNTLPPIKEVFLEAQVQVKPVEKSSVAANVASNVADASKHTFSSLKSSMKGVMGKSEKETPPPTTAPAQTTAPAPTPAPVEEKKKSGLSGFASKLGIGKKN